MNQGENVTLQCHASHDPTMDLTFTWALNGVLLDLEDPAGPYHRVEGVSETFVRRSLSSLRPPAEASRAGSAVRESVSKDET